MAKRPPRKIPDDEMASILSFADTTSDEAAAAKFNCTTRTIQRRRAAMKAGNDPGLSALVMLIKGEAVAPHKDLLNETHEAALKRLRDLLPEAGIKEIDKVIAAVQATGELKISHTLFLGANGDGSNETHAGPHQPNATVAGDQSGAARFTH